MNSNDDFIAQLEDYLETFDGLTPLPGRVRDAIRAELPSVRQVQPRPDPLRVFTMLSNASAGARSGLAAAAVVAAVVLGAAYLNNNRSAGVVGTVPTATPASTIAPSPAPASTPTSAPSATADLPALRDGTHVACSATDTEKNCLEPGTYQLTGGPGLWPVTVTVDVPAGWFEWDAGAGWDAVLAGEANVDSGWGVMFYTVGDVTRDPCDSTKGSIPAAQVDTPQRLAAAMAAWRTFKASTPQAITVDGHRGLKFQLTSTANRFCGDTGSAGHSSSGASVDVYPMITSTGAPGTQYVVTVEIVDTGNGLLVIRATDFPQTSPFELSGGLPNNPTRHAADQVKLHAILASIRLVAPQPSTSQ